MQFANEHNQPELRKLNSVGGLFDVEPCELDLNVGKRCEWIVKDCGIKQDGFTIVGVQKLFDGTVAYRVVADSDSRKFGMPARPNEIHIQEGDDAK